MQSPAIFTDNLEGYVKLAIAVITSSAAGVSLVGWWIKRGSDNKIGEIRSSINGLGGRVTEVESECRMSAAWRVEYGQQRIREEADRKELRERLVKLEANMERFTADIHEHHRELRDLLEKNAREQLEAVHRVELEMAELKGQNNVGDALKEMGRSIERAVRNAIQQDRE